MSKRSQSHDPTGHLLTSQRKKGNTTSLVYEQTPLTLPSRNIRLFHRVNSVLVVYCSTDCCVCDFFKFTFTFPHRNVFPLLCIYHFSQSTSSPLITKRTFCFFAARTYASFMPQKIMPPVFVVCITCQNLNIFNILLDLFSRLVAA